MPKKNPNMNRTKSDPKQVEETVDFLIKITAWKNSQKVDIFDPTQCRERVSEYFMLCRDAGHRPTLQELAIVLGVDRRRLMEIYTGNHYAGSKYARLPFESQQAIIDAYNIVLGNVEAMLANGAINPISGIFLAKNMGMKDTNDYFDSGSTRETPDVERLKTQYLNQLPDKGSD